MTVKPKIVIFAGTSDGRQLIEDISGTLEVHACVATEYGAQLLSDSRSNIFIHEGRLDVPQMRQLIEDSALVIDATHPYADKVTVNIKKAASMAGVEYARLLRDQASYDDEDIVYVNNTDEAIEYLNGMNEKVLLTVGSKELPKYKAVRDWQDRIYARVLPMKEVVTSCIDEGFQVNRLIAMQGPFSEDLNIALIDQIGAGLLVTKDGGSAGGFLEKLEATKACRIKLLVIGRPTEEEGYLPAEMREYLKNKFGDDSVKPHDSDLQPDREIDCFENSKRFFPIFYDTRNLKVAVVGAGEIATRRIKALSEFECKIKVISKEVSEDVKHLASMNSRIEIVERPYEESLIDGADMVLAATSDSKLNESIARKAAQTAVFYNSASDKEECNFYFPAIIATEEVTIGLTAQGRNHRLVKEMRILIERALGEIK